MWDAKTAASQDYNGINQLFCVRIFFRGQNQYFSKASHFMNSVFSVEQNKKKAQLDRTLMDWQQCLALVAAFFYSKKYDFLWNSSM